MSISSDSLREGLKSVDALIALESNYSDPPETNDIDTVHALRGATIVLLVAAFENYLKLRIQEAVRFINTHIMDDRLYDFELLPDKIRVNHYFLATEYALRGSGYDGKTRADRVEDIKSAAMYIHSNRLDYLAFSQTKGNPSSEVLSGLLNNLSILDCFRLLKPIYETFSGVQIAETYLNDKLNSLIKSRNRIAHTASSSHVARQDIFDFRNFIEYLSRSIDEILSNHCADLVLAARRPQD